MRCRRGVLGVALLVLALGLQTVGPPAAPAVQAGPLPAPGAQQGPGPLSPPLSVRVGLLASVSDSGVYIGLARGYYHELGLDLNVETIGDPNTIVTLTSANQLDVGGSGVTANPFQAAARGIPVKMVADKGQQRPGFGYYPLIVRQALWDDGELRTFADLRGRQIGKLSRCDSQDPQLERALERGGLTRDDVELRYMGFPDMNAALANGGLDATWQVEPLATLAEANGIAHRLAGGDEIYPNQQLAALYYAPDFAARTDAAQRFMIAYIRSLRDYNDAFVRNVGRADVAQILAQYTTVTDLSLYDRIVPAGLDPDGRLNVPGIRDDVALFERLGCITGTAPDVSQVVDESYVNYALGVLGPYAR
ncbi:MAG TPA: ABC transporter substrate-binding protein [Chloroflexota bacterium]|nr:ABC transporter substrate-binding protein [Chloroflexota bacterium]